MADAATSSLETFLQEMSFQAALLQATPLDHEGATLVALETLRIVHQKRFGRLPTR